MTTPNIAKTKWCPMYQAAVNDLSSTHSNRTAYDPTGSSEGHCLADGCMVWVWKAQPAPVKAAKGRTAEQPATEGDGFCGLAGK
jgi:hypothetical protein